MSLADIANSTQMRQGNVYYYFKTKQELATAVLAHCDATLKDTIRLLEDLPPHERLTKFLDHIADQSTNYSQWGCPIAGLSVEMLLELQGNNDVQLLHVYTTYLNWFERTFKELGLTAPAAKQRSGLLLAGLQGSIHVAHVSGNDRVIHDFAESAKQQIATLV